jgi:hypothetical protein
MLPIKKLVKILIITSLVVAFHSCMKPKEYPPEPQIEFVTMERYKMDSAFFIFSFIDGDGDLGLDTGEVFPPYHIDGPYYQNCFIDYYELQNGEWVKIVPDQPFYYRFPIIPVQGRFNAIEGEISIEMGIHYDFLSPFDTIKYSCFIYDRAHNKSNTIETPPMRKKIF